MAITEWSTTASNNDDGVTGINWLEGQAPSTVNNSARAMMADIASWRDEIDLAGVIEQYAGTSVPTGWLACDGALYSRATYARLFAAIGTTYGAGDGSTTFAVPDTRRRVLVGSGGTGTAPLANTVGSTGGAETHSLTSGEGPTHNHTASGTVPAAGDEDL